MVSILSLPGELLRCIIELTRTSDFEPFILSCKYIYHVGEDLIVEHNACNAWIKNNITPLDTSPSPLELLDRISSAPRYMQQSLLEYIQKLVIYSVYNEQKFGKILTNIKVHAPVIQQKLEEWVHDPLLEAEKHAEELDWEATRSKFGPNLSSERSFWVMRPSLPFYNFVAPLLIMNAQVIVITSPPLLLPQITLPWLVKSYRGQMLFQSLERLFLYATTRTTLSNIAAWSLLPNLKTLVVYNLATDQSLPKEFSRPTYDWPYGEHIPSLENLVLLRATANSELFGTLIRPFKALRTLLWDDAMFYFDECDSDEEWSTDDEKTAECEDEPVLEPDLDPGDESIDLDEIPTLSRGRIIEDDIFKPNELVKHLSSYQGNTLEKLILTLNINEWTYIIRRYRVNSMKEFTSLTHLDVDSQILAPGSLVDILPASLHVCRLRIRNATFSKINELLRDMPSRLPEISQLQHIEVLIVTGGSPSSLIIEMRHLQLQLQELKVSLDIGELENGDDYPWVSLSVSS